MRFKSIEGCSLCLRYDFSYLLGGLELIINMFNTAGSARRFNNWKVLGGVTPGDYDSHRTMFAGPDPADPSRVLVRKLV